MNNSSISVSANQNAQPIDFYPFAYALFDENLERHCWYCLDEENKHKRCTGCHRAMFCGQNCQLLAWKDHKFECRGIRANNGKVPDIEVRLLGRIMARHKAILCGLDKKDPNFYRDRHSRRNVMDIWAHTKSIKEDGYAMRKFEGIFARLCQFYDQKAMLSRETVFELHCRDFINRHAISDQHYLREIGKGLYLDLCAYDHSCRPNTVYSCRSFVATLRPLHPGVNMLDRSTTFYSYIDLLCAKQDRRKLLKDTWYFNCECERCMDESEHILTAMLCPHCPPDCPAVLCPFGQSDYKDKETQLITCPRCGTTLKQETVVEAIAAMRFIGEMLEKTDFERMDRDKAISMLEGMLSQFRAMLPPVNVFFCKIVQALLPFIDQQQNEGLRLLELHLLAEQCVRQCYPRNHPAIAFHLRNIGIFAKEQNDQEMALRYLEEALTMFEFVMGKDHSLSTTTMEILEEVKQKRGGGEGANGREEKEQKRDGMMEEKEREEEKGGEKKGRRKKWMSDGRKEEKQEGTEEEEEEEKKQQRNKDGRPRRRRRKEHGKKEQQGKRETGKTRTEEEGRDEQEEEEERKGGGKEGQEEKEGEGRGGGEGRAAGILLEVEGPPEDSERGGERPEQELVSSLVQLSISRAEGEVPGHGQEEALVVSGRGPEVEQRLLTAQLGGTSTSSSLCAEGNNSLSPEERSLSDGGVKRKLLQKKGTRRRRTPLPPMQQTEGDEERSETSMMEDPPVG